jgi:hypothetical protein
MALRNYLLADPTVNGLVGGERIHPTRLPQNQVEPSVVYVKVAEVGDYNMAGDSGLANTRMQIDSWAQSSDAATELANAVYDRLTGAKDIVDIGSGIFVQIRASFLVNGRDDYDEVVQLYRVSRDFTLWYAAR